MPGYSCPEVETTRRLYELCELAFCSPDFHDPDGDDAGWLVARLARYGHDVSRSEVEAVIAAEAAHRRTHPGVAVVVQAESLNEESV